MMAVVLQEDFKVHYNPARATMPGVFEPNDKFFADSKDVFIHGLMEPTTMGTCSSLPVLYVAVGRRLGYPLYLVSCKNHLFVRWLDTHTSLNLEATSEGLVTHESDYYKSWPYKIDEEEIKAEGFLKSMTPEEDLACFMAIRGHCLMSMGRYDDAIAAHKEALRLAPQIRSYKLALDLAEREAKERILADRLRQIDQVNSLLDPETRNARIRSQATGRNP